MLTKKPETSINAFDAYHCSDASKLFVLFDNVMIRRKKYKDKDAEVLCHLYGKALDFYY